MNRPLDMDMNFMFPGMAPNMGGPQALMPPPGQMGNMGCGMPGMGMPMAPPKPLNLIKLNKPELKASVKLKAFVWKRVILDRQGGS